MRVPQSPDDLQSHLSEQLGFLARSASAFDAGELSEGKRMAATIRLLVHDTNSSQSLLAQLLLKSIAFLDGAEIPNPSNLGPTAGLTGIRMSNLGFSYVPKFSFPNGRTRCVQAPFARWWRRAVIVDDERVELSRKDLILAIANTDGGAHVDTGIERTYARLSRQNSIGWTAITPAGKKVIPGLEMASVRQIAWEVHESLQLRERIMLTSVETKAVGRNDPCPCGSEVKFKKCHGGAA